MVPGMTDVKPQRAGAYRIVARLPGGGEGVHLAEDRRGRRVVLKLAPRGAGEREGLAELALLGLRHPGLASCLDAGRLPDDGRLYTVTEFVAGAPLDAGALPATASRPEMATRLCAQLLAALGALHDGGRLHRDLKPANVLLEASTGRPVLLDFGLSCTLAEAGTAPAAGTPVAMAPELFRGEPASIASDLWAAGWLLAQALLGRTLFAADDARRRERERDGFAGFDEPDVARLGGAPIARLLERLLAPSPAARPQDWRAALAALPADAPLREQIEDEVVSARLSATLVAGDPRHAARVAAIQRGAVFIEGFGPQTPLEEALADLAELGRGVALPGERLAGRLAALQSGATGRPLDFAALVEAFAQQVQLVVGIGLAVADEPRAAERREVARLLEGVAGVELFDEPRPTAAESVAALSDWIGRRPVLEQRLLDAPPATRDELAEALVALQRGGVVQAGAAGLTVDESRLPAAWPLAGPGDLPEGLTGDEAAVLALVALSPLPLAAPLVEQALERPVQATLSALVERGLLARQRSQPADLYAPVDGRLRRAAARRGVAAGARARLCRRLAGDEALDERAAAAIADVLGEQPPDGRDEAAFSALVADAADVLRRVGRLARAVTLLERGLAGVDPALAVARRLHLDRIDTLIRANAHDRALAAVEQARAQLPGDQALLVRQARVLQLRGRAGECAALLEALRPDGLPRDDALLGLQVRATARQAVGRLNEALADCREALRRAGGQDDRRTMALLERTASVEEKLGLFDEAARHFESCIAMARRLGHDLLVGSPLYNMGRALRARGDKRRGLALQEEGAARMESAGDLVGLATALNGLGAGWLQLGRVDSARRCLARGLELARRLGDDALEAMMLNNTGRALAAEGRLAEAEQAFGRSLQLRAARSDRRGQAAVELTRGKLQLQRGRLEPAQADLDAARDHLAGLTAPDWEIEALLLEAGLALARGEAAQLAEPARAALALAEKHAFGAERLRALDLLARTGASDLEELRPESLERGSWLADLLFTRAQQRWAHGREDAGDADAALALSILGEAPDGPVEARGLLLRAHADLSRLDGLMAGPSPEYGKVGELIARASRDLERARALTDVHDLQPLRADLEHAAGRLAATGESGDMTALAALAERLRNLERLAEINKALNEEHEPQRLLELIVDSAIELTGAARGFLILFDGKAEDFRAARNIDESTIRHPEFEISHSVARRVVQEGRPILTANAIDDPRLASAQSISELKLLSILCVPLVSRQRVLGAIYLDHPQVVGRFDERHLGTVLALAEQAAIALENARLSDGLARTNQQLRQSREEVARLNEALQERLKDREAELETVRESLDASRRALALRYDYGNIVTRSPKIHAVLDLMDRITDTEFPVIIQGESGTGKELLARAIHFHGPRKEKNFLSLNCAAIAEPLIESELFGSMRGAFTGADRDRKGLFEQAHGGTLFLDEIGDMSEPVQKRLLRVLQEGEFLPVGGREPRKVDVRVLCATHRDLKAMVAAGTFREDLYYRLAVAQIRLPPLRERPEDIALLVPYFLKRHGGAPREIDPEALALLSSRPWPGNVRELENFVMNLLLFDREGSRLTADMVRRVLDVEGEAPPAAAEEPADEPGGIKARLENYERRLIQQSLERAGGNKAKAARDLGIGVRTLYKMLDRLGL